MLYHLNHPSPKVPPSIVCSSTGVRVILDCQITKHCPCFVPFVFFFLCLVNLGNSLAHHSLSKSKIGWYTFWFSSILTYGVRVFGFHYFVKFGNDVSRCNLGLSNAFWNVLYFWGILQSNSHSLGYLLKFCVAIMLLIISLIPWLVFFHLMRFISIFVCIHTTTKWCCWTQEWSSHTNLSYIIMFHAVLIACYLINRMPSSFIQGQFPHDYYFLVTSFIIYLFVFLDIHILSTINLQIGIEVLLRLLNVSFLGILDFRRAINAIPHTPHTLIVITFPLMSLSSSFVHFIHPIHLSWMSNLSHRVAS